MIWIAVYIFKRFWGKESTPASDAMTGWNEEHILEFEDESVLSSILPELSISVYQEKHLPLLVKQLESSLKHISAIVFPIFSSFKNGWFYFAKMVSGKYGSTVLSLSIFVP